LLCQESVSQDSRIALVAGKLEIRLVSNRVRATLGPLEPAKSKSLNTRRLQADVSTRTYHVGYIVTRKLTKANRLCSCSI
jgi:hypothetical protein